MVEYLDDLESRICFHFNALSRWMSIRHFFSFISRLGDFGAYLVASIGCSLVLGAKTPSFLVHVIATGLAGLLVYQWLKRKLVRERPYVTHRRIICGTAPLDRYSFPSGHTLHAVSFAIVFWAYVPESAWIMAPFAVLVAASRLVLGLHYPTDVLVGAILGALIATGSLLLV